MVYIFYQNLINAYKNIYLAFIRYYKYNKIPLLFNNYCNKINEFQLISSINYYIKVIINFTIIITIDCRLLRRDDDDDDDDDDIRIRRSKEETIYDRTSLLMCI